MTPYFALDAASRAAREAGHIIHTATQRSYTNKESDRDLITETDQKTQEAIVAVLRKDDETMPILGEEGTPSLADAVAAVRSLSSFWIVDPLDGTTNFVHRFPAYAVSIAYVRDGELTAGVVYDPIRDELSTAATGHPSTLNGQRIGVQECPRLREAILGTGFHYTEEGRFQALREIAVVAPSVRNLRALGSAALQLAWGRCRTPHRLLSEKSPSVGPRCRCATRLQGWRPCE